MKIVAICLALALSGCSYSFTGKALNVGVIGSGTADLYTTHRAMQRGAVELNGFMGQSAWQQIAVKSAFVASTLWATQRLDRYFPWWSHALRIAAIGWQMHVVNHNAGVGR